jgi:hypothetical protein
MKKIYLELPIVKVDPANNWHSKDYAREHFEKGLFIADDGVMYHLVFYQDEWPTMIPIPKEQIEAALVEEARQSGIAEVNGDIANDIDDIKDKLDECLAWMGRVNDEVVSRTQGIEDKIDDLGRSGGGGGVNILDVAKSYAVIQKPELIKEL